MKEVIRSEYITFRVTPAEKSLIENAALAMGEKPRNWCRDLVLEVAGNGRVMTRNERIIFEELSRVRYLIGSGFKTLTADDEVLAEHWEEVREFAISKGAEIADQLLANNRSIKTIE